MAEGGRTVPSLAAMTTMQWLMLVAGIVIVTVVMIHSNRRRLAQLRQEPKGPDRRAAGDIRDQLEALMVQLEELARATNAQIETRFAKLEVLLKEADEKIARLHGLLARAEGRPGTADQASPGDVRPEHRQVHQLADAGRSPVEIARELGRDVGEIELILSLRKK